MKRKIFTTFLFYFSNCYCKTLYKTLNGPGTIQQIYFEKIIGWVALSLLCK